MTERITVKKCSNIVRKMVQVYGDQEKAELERNSHFKTEMGKTKLTFRYLYLEILRKHIVSRVSSYFPTGGHSVTRN